MTEKKVLTPALKSEATNGLTNDRGTVAMARTSDPHSAKVQFFVNLKDNSFLNHRTTNDPQGWGYTVFGKVSKGMDVVDKIAKPHRQCRLLRKRSDDACHHPERQNHLRKIRTFHDQTHYQPWRNRP